jgi:RNA polymerase-binding transcription factor DksA
VASDLAEEEVAEALRTNVLAHLFEIEDAVARLDGGTYGHCERCTDVDPARSGLCLGEFWIDCQRRTEQLAS